MVTQYGMVTIGYIGYIGWLLYILYIILYNIGMVTIGYYRPYSDDRFHLHLLIRSSHV